VKSELKQERCGLLKIQGPRCEDWKLPGTFLRKLRGIYIIMYINSRVYLQRSQVGLDLKNLIDLGGFSARVERHKNRSKGYEVLQGVFRNRHLLP
jgi:hypothetical protein